MHYNKKQLTLNNKNQQNRGKETFKVVETYLLWKGCPHKLRHICEVVKGKW
jgi:hypothetical protein